MPDWLFYVLAYVVANVVMAPVAVAWWWLLIQERER